MRWIRNSVSILVLIWRIVRILHGESMPLGINPCVCPTFTDLWYKSPTQEGNMGLRPEENNSVRIGTDFNHPVVNIQVKAHYQRGTNLIDWVMRSPDDIYHATAFSLDTYGAGLDAKINLSRWWGEKQPFESFQLSYAWFTNTDAKVSPILNPTMLWNIYVTS